MFKGVVLGIVLTLGAALQRRHGSRKAFVPGRHSWRRMAWKMTRKALRSGESSTASF